MLHIINLIINRWLKRWISEIFESKSTKTKQDRHVHLFCFHKQVCFRSQVQICLNGFLMTGSKYIYNAKYCNIIFCCVASNGSFLYIQIKSTSMIRGVLDESNMNLIVWERWSAFKGKHLSFWSSTDDAET